MNKGERLRKKGILILKRPNEEKEVNFELDYLRSLSLEQRFSMMWAKSREMKALMGKNGNRKAASIIKRK